jgi:hypothetical protein
MILLILYKLIIKVNYTQYENFIRTINFKLSILILFILMVQKCDKRILVVFAAKHQGQ